MKYYTKILKHLTSIKIDEKIAHQYLKNEILDDVFYDLERMQNELKKVQNLLTSIRSIENTLFEKALKNADEQKNAILEFYEKFFVENPFMGDPKVYENPDIVVLLGCNLPILDLRIKATIPYLKKHPKAIVVLSGAGYQANQTEAFYMHAKIQKAKLKNTFLLEQNSMDTLGNALFTKLLLKDKKHLTKNTRIMIITSRFHASRALYYFKTIFNTEQTFPIATHGVQTKNQNLQKMAKHELMTEHRASSTTGIFNRPAGDTLDDQDMLLKLFENHGLYKKRYDILREWLKKAQ